MSLQNFLTKKLVILPYRVTNEKNFQLIFPCSEMFIILSDIFCSNFTCMKCMVNAWSLNGTNVTEKIKHSGASFNLDLFYFLGILFNSKRGGVACNPHIVLLDASFDLQIAEPETHLNTTFKLGSSSLVIRLFGKQNFVLQIRQNF